MKKLRKGTLLVIAVGFLAAASTMPAAAQSVIPVPITAEQAFDAVQTQIDPLTAQDKLVILVDIRTRAEQYWVGTAAMVTKIVLADETTVVPDLGKVKLIEQGSAVLYHVDGHLKITQTRKIKSMSMAPIAYHVPYESWNEADGTLFENTEFGATMTTLAGTTKPVLILSCRSGGRTDAKNAVARLDTSLFDTIYEIDQPDNVTNVGGIEGSAHGNVYNGYRGFPGRDVQIMEHPSVSWKDAGLPIVIGSKPLPIQ